jgi:hypothetical protein
MQKLKFGLNVKRKNIFSQDAETEKESRTDKESAKRVKESAISKQELEIVKDALEQDADIFDYDKNYSKFSNVPKKQDKESRYIKNLLKVSEKRKFELELAKEKRMQKELEKEGQEFSHKEKFVTQGYLEKLKELQDKEKELQEENSEKSIEKFYRNLLFSEKSSDVSQDLSKEENNIQEIAPVQEEIVGDNVIKNDSEEIIDKRLYLKGGLNFTKKIKRENTEISKGKESVLQEPFRKKYTRIKSDFRKQKEEIEAKQIKELELKKEKLEKEQESKISEKQVLSAKERYLQRKKLQS